MARTASQLPLRLMPELPARVRCLPKLRYMGSKHRLLPWIHETLDALDFETALDAFAGSGCVSYLLKSMEKQVTASDFLNFSFEINRAAVENSRTTLTDDDVELLCRPTPHGDRFIETTFGGIFFTRPDLVFLDQVWNNMRSLRQRLKRSVAIAALVRACVKRQPRGVFTVAGDPEHYKDGRRDLRLSLREHFLEGIHAYNSAVFSNGRRNRALRSDVFDVSPDGHDLVYLDPPYVPRSDDNCYIKRYHFLEGLSSYWRDANFVPGSRVHKLVKPFTPFSYRRTADAAFLRLFQRFSNSILVLSYSSNGYPTLDVLVSQMSRFKKRVEVFEKPHRYHFGTHRSARRNSVTEYLIIGR